MRFLCFRLKMNKGLLFMLVGYFVKGKKKKGFEQSPNGVNNVNMMHTI